MFLGGLLTFLCLLMVNIIGGNGTSVNMPRSGVNTLISASSSCMVTMLIHQMGLMIFYNRKTSMLTIINALIAGVVSVYKRYSNCVFLSFF